MLHEQGHAVYERTHRPLAAVQPARRRPHVHDRGRGHALRRAGQEPDVAGRLRGSRSGSREGSCRGHPRAAAPRAVDLRPLDAGHAPLREGAVREPGPGPEQAVVGRRRAVPVAPASGRRATSPTGRPSRTSPSRRSTTTTTCWASCSPRSCATCWPSRPDTRARPRRSTSTAGSAFGEFLKTKVFQPGSLAALARVRPKRHRRGPDLAVLRRGGAVGDYFAPRRRRPWKKSASSPTMARMFLVWSPRPDAAAARRCRRRRRLGEGTVRRQPRLGRRGGPAVVTRRSVRREARRPPDGIVAVGGMAPGGRRLGRGRDAVAVAGRSWFPRRPASRRSRP